MAIASITTNTDGRAFDLEALQTIDGGNLSLTPLSLTLSDKNVSRRITGIQKLVQRYALLFLQFQGSVKFAPEQGTGFLNAAYAGAIQNGEHVSHQFLFANTAVIDQLRFDDSSLEFGGAPPDDERISAANLLDYSVDTRQARLFLRIQIINLLGDSTTLVLPTK